MFARIITYKEFEHHGETHLITVRKYGEDHVTAQWSGPSQTGELNFGVGNCDEAIELAERKIVEASRAHSGKV